MKSRKTAAGIKAEIELRRAEVIALYPKACTFEEMGRCQGELNALAGILAWIDQKG